MTLLLLCFCVPCHALYCAVPCAVRWPLLQTRAISDKTQELKSRHAAAVSALLARYQQLRSEVSRYNKALAAVMAGSGGGGVGEAAAAAAAGGADVCSGRDQ